MVNDLETFQDFTDEEINVLKTYLDTLKLRSDDMTEFHQENDENGIIQIWNSISKRRITSTSPMINTPTKIHIARIARLFAPNQIMRSGPSAIFGIAFNTDI